MLKLCQLLKRSCFVSYKGCKFEENYSGMKAKYLQTVSSERDCIKLCYTYALGDAQEAVGVTVMTHPKTANSVVIQCFCEFQRTGYWQKKSKRCFFDK